MDESNSSNDKGNNGPGNNDNDPTQGNQKNENQNVAEPTGDKSLSDDTSRESVNQVRTTVSPVRRISFTSSPQTGSSMIRSLLTGSKRPSTSTEGHPGPAKAPQKGLASTFSPRCSSMSQPGPSSMSQPGPSSMSQPGPSSMSQPGPSSMSQPGPSSMSQQGPSSMSQPGPSSLSQIEQETKRRLVRTRSSYLKPGWNVESVLNDSVDPFGNNALHLSVSHKEKKPKNTEILLVRGFNPNVRNSIGMTPIHLAVKNANFTALDLLIKYGGDINIRDSHDRTPIFYTSRTAYLPRVMAHGPMLNVVETNGYSLLQYLIKYTAEKMHLNRRLLGLNYLLSKGIDVGTSTALGDNLLHTLAEFTSDIHDFVEHKHDMATTLLELGVDVNQKNLVGDTPLHICVKYDCQYTRIFLKHGGDMNIKNKVGLTPLHIARTKRFSRCFCFNVMVRHLIVRLHKGLTCRYADLKLVFRADETKFMNYNRALNELKTKRIIRTDPRTYYDILIGTRLELQSIINNHKMLNSLCFDDFVFIEELEDIKDNALEYERSKKAIELLMDALWDVLPYLCIKQIVLFMSQQDVKKLLTKHGLF